MPLKIVRNDITKMHTEAVVNTANPEPTYSLGCDTAIYRAAGEEQLLKYRRDNIGYKEEGEVFITPGFDLSAKYIIHAVSPYFVDGNGSEEEKLRSCYRKGLQLAVENGIQSIAFPLISTGGFGYPKEEGMRIAVDEINAFLLNNRMDIYLVVFDDKATRLGEKIYPELESYIDHNYVSARNIEEYGDGLEKSGEERAEFGTKHEKEGEGAGIKYPRVRSVVKNLFPRKTTSQPMAGGFTRKSIPDVTHKDEPVSKELCVEGLVREAECFDASPMSESMAQPVFDGSNLDERIKHLSDTFSEYLLYLIESKGLDNVEVYKKALVDKKIFSKIKNNRDYHPQKRTAMCLCVGAGLNLDETKDLLARAGYALSPCDKTDIIFSFFIEHQIYDMIEIDIQLEEHGLPCIIE